MKFRKIKKNAEFGKYVLIEIKNNMDYCTVTHHEALKAKVFQWR